MKTFTVQEAQGRLGELIADVNRGDVIVLIDGDKEVTLHPGRTLDLDQDSPELEAELLKAVEGPHTAFPTNELHEIASRGVKQHRAKRAS
jgi:hypothetical protein